MFGGSSGFTIEGWVKPTAANGWARLIDFGNGAGNNNVLLSVGGQGGRDLTLVLYNGGTGTNFVASNVITENTWQHVAATFVPNGTGGGTATLYLDGAVVNSGAVSVAPAAVTRTANYIGKSNWNDPYFQGSIQDVAIYPTALNAATVLAHYTTGADEVQPTSSYSYNGDGLRMTKIGAGSASLQQFTYDSTASVPKVLNDSKANYIYGADGYPLEMIQGSTVTWYHHDRLGSTRVLTDSSGAVVGSASYSPYGVSTISGTTTPLGYAGAYEDTDTGLIYLIHRYYDPATGQFLSVDPAVAITQSSYSYANDNPTNQIDPTGLFGWSTITGVVESTVSVVHTVSKVVTTVAGGCAVIAGLTGAEAISAGCGTVAVASAGVQAATGVILAATGHESESQLAADLIASGLTFTGVGASQLARTVGGTADDLLAAADETPWTQVLSKGGLYLAGGAYASLAAIARVLGISTEALANVKDWGDLASLVQRNCGDSGTA